MGWFANALILYSAWLIGHRRRQGFIWNFIGEVIWTARAFSQGQYDLSVICFVFCVMSVWSYRKWGARMVESENKIGYTDYRCADGFWDDPKSQTKCVRRYDDGCFIVITKDGTFNSCHSSFDNCEDFIKDGVWIPVATQ